ncbi:MAG: YHS domain-containing protein [Gemmatimonadota bacterium]|nr:MAG: YHS domain-containing protein [Gemmatimonadota bacterium]
MSVQDEVCGMTLEAEGAAASTDFQERTYYFCSDRCRTMFEEEPGRYVPVHEEMEDGGGTE